MPCYEPCVPHHPFTRKECDETVDDLSLVLDSLMRLIKRLSEEVAKREMDEEKFAYTGMKLKNLKALCREVICDISAYIPKEKIGKQELSIYLDHLKNNDLKYGDEESRRKAENELKRLKGE